MIETLAKSISTFLRESASPAAHQGEAFDLLRQMMALTRPLLRKFDPSDSHRVSCNQVSFHIPLSRCIGQMLHAIVSCMDRKMTLRRLLRSADDEAASFWMSLISRPLQVMALSNQVRAGLWVRNGHIM